MLVWPATNGWQRGSACPTLGLVFCFLFALPGGILLAADPAPTKKDLEFFEKEVRPILVARCHKCHGETKQSGGLRLDRIVAIRAGGESGPAVVPGKPSESLLIDAIHYASFEMPPTGRLPASEVAVLTRWVERGAPWPTEAALPPSSAAQTGKISDDDRRWWAFQPVQKPDVPEAAIDGWGINEIDRFIGQKLREARLEPAPEADRTALVRRLYFDLIGLPPSPEEVQQFVADPASGAYEALVDRLLVSPQYGQRWARHWLDLVRYADSDGYRIDDYRPYAWRFRDYVIRSLNADKPYDRFVQEQLAGDELFPGDPEALIATGYLRHWIYEYNNRDVRTQWQIILDDITDTTGDVFLGLGMQCARCHDHKFDPILQKDYYRLQAFFSGLWPREDLVAATAPQQADFARALAKWEEKTVDLRRQIDAIEAPYREKAETEAVIKFPQDIQDILHKPLIERDPLERQLGDLAFRQVYYAWDRIDRSVKGEDKERLVELRKQLAAFDNIKPDPLPAAFAATDLGPEAAPVFIPKKGQQPIEPGFLTIFGEEPADIARPADGTSSTGRRSALARWLTRPDNPLTMRVIVNRIWQQHFGRGLAANASDFGRLGETPTHPELLDWLAAQFVADGWSLKKLHKRIVMSASYRQSAAHPNPQPGRLGDPENRLYWRGQVRRLDAEQIRDSLYAVTGELSLSDAGGPGVAGESPRRSIYLRVMRNTRNPVLESFDAPFWISSSASRYTTTTPVQSLMMINSQFFLKRAEALAGRVLSAPSAANDPQRVRRAYELALGRSPTEAETAAAVEFLRRQAGQVDVADAGSAAAAFLYDKIPFRDGQAAVVSAAQPPLSVDHQKMFPQGDFTIEAYFVLRSIYDSGSVRVIASNWAGRTTEPGWLFGVTGKGSRRKPQTLVLQLIGKTAQGQLVEEPIFSDHHIQLNKPYYAAASVKLAGENESGCVSFYVKDLSNDDEPLLSAEISHRVVGGFANELPLMIGGRGLKSDIRFDGLIDDVRLSESALGQEQLLISSEAAGQRTLGYWRFEAKPDVFADSSGHGLSLKPTSAASIQRGDVRRQAWIDFCHVLLNSSEFLYAR